MSRVLKGSQRNAVIGADVFDAKLSAKTIVERAQAQAEQIVEQADGVRQEAVAAGTKEGREAGLAEVAELVVRAKTVATRRADESEDELRRLAVGIAEKILARELELGNNVIVDIVKAALRDARARSKVTVRVNPADVAAVEAEHPQLSQQLANGSLAVAADETVEQGGCMIDTEVGTIDARLKFQLAAIERALCSE